jgi:hypothetical protein
MPEKSGMVMMPSKHHAKKTWHGQEDLWRGLIARKRDRLPLPSLENKRWAGVDPTYMWDGGVGKPKK